MCNRSLKQTAISLSSCDAEFYAASACARELLVIQTRQDTFCSAEDQADSNTLRYDSCQYSSGYERNVYLSLAKKIGLRILDGTDCKNGTNGTNDNG